MLEEEELRNTILCVFANKQDQPNPMSAVEVSTALGLTAIKDRQWQIFNSSALKNVGLEEGMSWLAQTINNRKK
jgi:ADP-ribosylation factor-like protein 1